MPARKTIGRVDDCSLQWFGAFGAFSGKEDIMNQEKSAITAARMINCVDDRHQRLFIDGLLAGLSEARRLQWMQLVCEMTYPDLVWKDLEGWLEKKFGRDPRKTPREVASLCRRRFRMNPKTLPFLVRIAQKVKLRVRARMRRHPELKKI